MADPVLAQHGTSLLERVAESPAFQRLLTRQLATGKTAEQIGQELEQKVTRALADPAVDRAIDERIDALMERPKVDRAEKAPEMGLSPLVLGQIEVPAAPPLR